MSGPPCWLNPSYRHCVVGNSLQPAVAPPPAPVTSPVNAFALLGRQLDLLSKWSAAPDGLKRAATRASAAFTSNNDLLSMSNYVGDANGTVSYLTSLVARLRTLSGGQSLVLARDDAVSGLCIFIVHRCSAAHAGSEFVVAICSSGTEALQYHPSRADAASGGTLQHASPLLLRDVPATRVCDGSFWYFALLAERKWCTPQVLFEKLCPALNAKPPSPLV